MKKNRRTSSKAHFGKGGIIAVVSIVLVSALVVSMFTGVIPARFTARAASGAGMLKSLDGENAIPATYTAVNVPAGTKTMTAAQFKNDTVGTSADGISAFDFHIFANRFAANVHTCGNIAVNELGYDVLGTTGAPEFGSRAEHDLDVARVSYIGKFNSWSAAATADYFVFGPDTKITGKKNQQVKSGNQMIGNDNDGKLVGKIYNENTAGEFINIANELTEAENYMRYQVWLMNKAKGSSKPVTVPVDGSNTTVQYLDKNAFHKGAIDFTNIDADTIAVSLTAKEAKDVLKGNITMKGTAGKRIIFNVNVDDGKDTFKLSDTMMTADALSNREETANLDNNILWNFYEMGSDNVPYSYDGVVNVNGTWVGTINAPKATVQCYAGLNGSIIADKVTSRNETHKSDYTGERVRTTSVSVPVHKIWDDDPSVRPDYITLKLKRNGEVYKTVQVTREDCSDASDMNNWYYSFTGLPATDAAGNTYQYKVEEAPIAGYETTQLNNTIYNSSDYTPVYYSLTVNKTDSSTNAPLEGAKFELTGNGVDLSGATAKSSGYQSGTFKTSATKVTWTSSGKAITISNLPKGDYTITEVSAPAGYRKAAPVSVKLTESKEETVKNTPLTIQVEKLNGSANNAFLPGSTFTLTADNVDFSKAKASGAADYKAHSDYLEWTSGHGTVTVSGIPAGTYTVTETSSPEGYDVAAPVTLVLSEDGKVTVGGSNVNGTVKVTDYLLPVIEEFYGLNINKYDEKGSILPDAQLELISVANKDLEKDYEITVSGAASSSKSGNKISFTTGSTAVSISGLPGGSYTLREVSAPSGYCLANDAAITLNKTNADANGIVTANMTDKLLEIGFNKVSSITSKALAGAKYKVEKVNGSSTETITASATTGSGTNTIRLPGAGTYVITETQAPAGYKVNSKAITLKVNEYGVITECTDAERWNSGSVTMADEPYQAELSKYYWNDSNKNGSIDNGETGLLSGAKLVLTAEGGIDLVNVSGSIPLTPKTQNGQKVTAVSWLSGSNPNVLYALPNGTYTLTEDEAPEGFEKTPGVRFTYNNGKITGPVKLGTAGKPEETPVLDGDNGIGIYDKKTLKSSIEIKKLNELGNPLEGAKFAVYNKNNCRDKDGNFDPDKAVVYFDSTEAPQKLILPDGDYYLVEVSAPEGYKRLEAPVEFNVNDGDIGGISGGGGSGGTRDASFTAELKDLAALEEVINFNYGGKPTTSESPDLKYLYVNLSDYLKKVEEITLEYPEGTDTSDYKFAVHSYAKNSEADQYVGGPANSYSPNANYLNFIAQDNLDDKMVGRVLVIEQQQGSSVVDPQFDSITIKFEDGVTVTIPKSNWGGVPTGSGSGSSSEPATIETGKATVLTAAEVRALINNDDYLLNCDHNAIYKNDNNKFLVIDISDQKSMVHTVTPTYDSGVNTSGWKLNAHSFQKASDATSYNSVHEMYGENCGGLMFEEKAYGYNNPSTGHIIVLSLDDGNGNILTPPYSKVEVYISNYKEPTFLKADWNTGLSTGGTGSGTGGEASPTIPVTKKVTVPGAGASVDPNAETPTLDVVNVPTPVDERYVYGFNIEKKDENGALITTGEASFKVYNSKDEQLGFTLTDGKYVYAPGAEGNVVKTSGGKLSIADLEEGSYYLYETEAPANYTLGGERINVTLPTDDAKTFDVTNNSIKGELLITKLDDKGNARSGAQFELYSYDGSSYTPVKVTQGDTVGYYVYDTSASGNTIVTGNSGHITVTGLPVGTKYFIKETQAPSGCKIDNTGYLPENGIELTSAAPGGAYTATDTTYQAKFVKEDKKTDAKLAGAVLELRPVTMSSDIAYPKFNGVSASLDTEHCIEYDYKDVGKTEKELYIKDEKLVWTSSDTVENIIYGLPAGEYILSEATAPVGYGTANSINVTVSADGKVNGGSIVTMYDDAKTGSVTLTKYDSFTGAPLKDAKFVLLCGDKYVAVDASGKVGLVSDKANAKVYETNDKGVISQTGLPFGFTYKFEETEAPAGYLVNTLGAEAQIKPDDLYKNVILTDDRAPATVVLNKTDKKGNPVDGAKFVFYRLESGSELYVKDVNGSAVFTPSITDATEYTTVNGKITIDDLFPWGYDYYAVEVSVPNGYLTPDNKVTPLDCPDGFNYSAGVENSKGALKILKQTDETEPKPLEDAVLSITKSDNADLTGVTVTIGGKSVGTLSSDGKSVSWNSAATAAVIENIPTGTYTLTEVTAPDGYEKAETITFVVDKDGKILVDNKEVTDKTVIMKDAPVTANVYISKIDMANSEELPGADLIVKDKDGKEVAKWTSTNEKHLIEKLGVGTYTLTEITAPDGYEKAETITFVVDKNGKILVNDKEVTDKTVIMKDAPVTANVYISKIDMANSEELPGADLIVKDKDGKEVAKWTSTTEKHLIEKLGVGTYTLTEITAPDGYEKAETITFVVDKDGKILVDNKEVTDKTVVMEDKPTTSTLTISKKAVGAGSELPGAKLTLTSISGKGFEGYTAPKDVTLKDKTLSWTSGSKEVELTMIPDGVYSLTETQAPAGYEIAETIYIKADGGKIYSVKAADYKEDKTTWGSAVDKNTVVMLDAVTPEKKTANFSFTKRSNVGSALAGAKFKLTGNNGYSKEMTSSSTGTVTFEALTDGIYTLTETAAPAGYTKSDAIVSVVVDSEGKLTYFDASAKPIDLSALEKLMTNAVVPTEPKNGKTDYKPGDTINLLSELLKEHDEYKDLDITWVSSDVNVATADKNGKVTIHKPGTFTITAKKGDVELGKFVLGATDNNSSSSGNSGQNPNYTPETGEKDTPVTGDSIFWSAAAIVVLLLSLFTMIIIRKTKKEEE